MNFEEWKQGLKRCDLSELRDRQMFAAHEAARLGWYLSIYDAERSGDLVITNPHVDDDEWKFYPQLNEWRTETGESRKYLRPL